MPSATSADDVPQLFQPLPGRTVDRSAGYGTLLRDLLDLVSAEPPEESGDTPGARRSWRNRTRRAIGAVVSRRAKEASEAGPVPEDWFEPLIRACVREPDLSFNRQLVEPAIAAFGRRRVQLALIAYLDTGTPADIAGAARAWYWTQVPLSYVGGSKTPTPASVVEYEAVSDLRQRPHRLAPLR